VCRIIIQKVSDVGWFYLKMMVMHITTILVYVIRIIGKLI